MQAVLQQRHPNKMPEVWSSKGGGKITIQNGFWIYADRKTVRRLTENEYFKLLYGKRKRIIGYIDDEAFCVTDRISTTFIPMRQFKEILALNDKTKPAKEKP